MKLRLFVVTVALPLLLTGPVGAKPKPTHVAKPKGGLTGKLMPTKAAPAHTFMRAAYLWNTAYDTDLKGSVGPGKGDWLDYKKWMGLTALGAEADPGWGPGDWWDCAQHLSWNAPWGKQQARYGAGLPDVVLSIGQMPSDPKQNDSWDQKLAWENATWKAEAANDPTIMGYFANYA
ncbi:MAG: hypothetical protein M3Y13_00760 [Armatimonadota bacterium]|nr:hypothetical protein [Armatimonadota bacterium]